jgi:hypothetical protein
MNMRKKMKEKERKIEKMRKERIREKMKRIR